MSPAVRGAGIVVAALLAALALYVGCALLLGAIPRNTGFVESENGIPVYVRTNGVHADLVVPTRYGAVDWSLDFPAAHMRALPATTDWIAFGWGDRGFMIETPTWSDLASGHRDHCAERCRVGGDACRVHRDAVRLPRAAGAAVAVGIRKAR